MTDDRIYELIKQDAEQKAKPDFEALMARIDENYGDFSFDSDLELESKKPAKYLKTIVASAAAIVIVSLTAVAVTQLGGLFSAKESAPEMVGADYAMQDSYALNDGEGLAESDEYSNEITGANEALLPDTEATEPVKDDVPVVTAGSNPLTQRSVSYQTHYLGALGMSIDLPADARVTGRDVDGSFALLGILGLSEAELEERMASRNIYLEAVLSDSDTTLTEIVVRMTADDSTDAIYNLKWADDYQLGLIEAQYSDYAQSENSVPGASYYDVSMVETEQALFFKAKGSAVADSTRANHLQYMTVINGMKIEITLIEYVDAQGETTVSEENEMLTDDIIYSGVHFDKVKNKLGLEIGAYGMFFIVISAASALVLCAYFFIKKMRLRRKAAIEFLPDE